VTERRRPALLPSGPPEAFARGKRPRDRSGEGKTEPPRGYGVTDGITGSVLIIDDDSEGASEVADLLAGEGHRVQLEPRFDDGINALRVAPPDVVLTDPFSSDGPREAFIDALRRPNADASPPEVVVLTTHASVDAAVSALHAGAADYVVKPASPNRVKLAIQRALDRRRMLNENERLKRDLALFAAAQRILEVLDAEQLVSSGLEALFTFGGADAAVVLHAGRAQKSRGLVDAEVQAIETREGALTFSRGTAKEFAPALTRFAEVLVLELGEGRSAVVCSERGFQSHHEEAALFLAYELATAFKNGARYADAELEARRDSLTGLWNARTFHQAAERLAAHADANALTFSLMFIDVDHFKEVNDVHGHVTGSRVLVELAETLVELLREGDVIARFGGDEFSVLLPEVDQPNALRVAERVRRSIEARRFRAASGEPISVTVCIGVATFPDHASTAQALLDRADRAMYMGKGATRNSVHVAALNS
jgi:diguanylate cyclase (GGDEF)-like protein